MTSQSVLLRMAKGKRDGADMLSLIRRQREGSPFLQIPDKKVVKHALYHDGIVLVHDLYSGQLVAGAMLSDKGVLPSGRRLFELRSVSVEPSVRGFELMPIMSVVLILPRVIYDGRPEDFSLEVIAVVANAPVPNIASLKQMPRCGFNPVSDSEAADIRVLRPLAEGRQLYLYDSNRSCELACNLHAKLQAPMLVHSKDPSRTLRLETRLSLVDDGVLERFIISDCKAVAA